MNAGEDHTALALVHIARELAPQIRAAADEVERQRRLTEPLSHALADAGFFRMLVPTIMGGGGADVMTFALVVEELAKVDASAAWCVGQCATCTAGTASMTSEHARKILGDKRACVAWGPGAGKAVAVEGGYRLTGQWSFGSGCHSATWLGGTATIVDASGDILDDSSEDTRTKMLLFPATSAKISETWNVIGLRGTGSDSYSVADIMVPHGYALTTKYNVKDSGPLYAFATQRAAALYGVAFAAVSLGIARGALIVVSSSSPQVATV